MKAAFAAIVSLLILGELVFIAANRRILTQPVRNPGAVESPAITAEEVEVSGPDLGGTALGRTADAIVAEDSSNDAVETLEALSSADAARERTQVTTTQHAVIGFTNTAAVDITEDQARSMTHVEHASTLVFGTEGKKGIESRSTFGEDLFEASTTNESEAANVAALQVKDTEVAGTSTEVESRTLASIVRIMDSDKNLIGNGVVISVDLENQAVDVLTAAHLLGQIERYAVTFFRRDSTPDWLFNKSTSTEAAAIYRGIQVIHLDTKIDLALLRVFIGPTNEPPASLKVSEDMRLINASVPVNFQSVLRVSWIDEKSGPRIEKLGPLNHSMVRRDAESEEIACWKLSQVSEPGMSGGPLVNESGELIGIASGNSGGHSYYVDLGTIRAFLHSSLGIQ